MTEVQHAHSAKPHLLEASQKNFDLDHSESLLQTLSPSQARLRCNPQRESQLAQTQVKSQMKP